MQRKRQGQLLINVVILGTAAPVSHVYGNVGRISLRKDRGFQEQLEQGRDDRENNSGPNINRTQTISKEL